jgi:O-succinylbenzoate synthase
MLESGVGRAYKRRARVAPELHEAGRLLPSARYWERDVVTPEWTMDKSGMVHVPLDKPGIGVAVDMDRIENLTVRAATLVPVTLLVESDRDEDP